MIEVKQIKTYRRNFLQTLVKPLIDYRTYSNQQLGLNFNPSKDFLADCLEGNGDVKQFMCLRRRYGALSRACGFGSEQGWIAFRTYYEVHAESNDEVRSCFYGHEQVSLVAWNKLMKHSLIKDSNLSFIEELTHEDIPWVFIC